MSQNRQIVKAYFESGKSRGDIFKEVKFLGIKRDFVYRTVKRLTETGSVDDKPRTGRPRTVRTKRLVKVVRERIRRNCQLSGREIAKGLKVNRESIRQVIKDDLHFKPYRKRKVHGLSANQRVAREVRSKRLLRRHAAQTVANIVFSDEKLFVVEESFNPQNNRVYGLSIEAIPEHLRTVQRFQKPGSLMVWGAMSKMGKCPLVFVDKGVKINAKYYQEEILERYMKPWANRIHGDANWCFQQDSAPAHSARTTQAWLTTNCPSFISKDDWPPSSPDLNPLDYSIWGVLEAKVNAYPHRSIESLKNKLIKEWKALSMDVVRAAIDTWRKRLTLCKDASGGRFESKLK
jgi:transposase